MNFRLKHYQQQTIDALEQFLADTRLMPVEQAFEQSLSKQGKTPFPYRHYSFEQVPTCLYCSHCVLHGGGCGFISNTTLAQT